VEDASVSPPRASPSDGSAHPPRLPPPLAADDALNKRGGDAAAAQSPERASQPPAATRHATSDDPASARKAASAAEPAAPEDAAMAELARVQRAALVGLEYTGNSAATVAPNNAQRISAMERLQEGLLPLSTLSSAACPRTVFAADTLVNWAPVLPAACPVASDISSSRTQHGAVVVRDNGCAKGSLFAISVNASRCACCSGVGLARLSLTAGRAAGPTVSRLSAKKAALRPRSVNGRVGD
jgi:hypothetical protein